jgi:integrase
MAWYARKEPGCYQIAWREPATRKQRYKSFKTLDAARSFKSQVEAQLDRGDYTPQDQRRMPLGQYVDLVLAAGDLGASTLGAYHYRRRHTADLEKKPIGDVTSADIRLLMGRMEAEGLGAPIRSSVRKLLSKVFAAAVRDGVLVRNPVASVPNPRSERREILVYTSQEVAALAEAVGPALRPAVLLSAYGGLRGGEVAGLRVQDVDWLRATVTVNQAVKLVRGAAVIGTPKTKASRRTVNVPRFVIEALDVEAVDPTPPCDGVESRERPTKGVVPGGVGSPGTSTGGGKASTWRLAAADAGSIPAPSTLLFPRHSSKTLGAAFRRALEQTGLTGRWHDLRHTSVAFAIEQGAHPKAIQLRLGHESITTTLDTYGHLFEGIDADLAARMETAYANAPEARVVGLPSPSEESGE